jgi:hypothetical protein
MFKPKTIFVSLDLTKMDYLLLAYTAYLLKSVSSIEKIVFYHNILIDYQEETESILEGLDQPLDKFIEQEIEQTISAQFAEIDYEILITREESTSDTISKICKDRFIELVLFGKKNTYQGSGYLMEKLIHRNLRSMLLIVPESAHHRVQKLLVPIDFTAKSKFALETGYELSKYFEANVSCQYVYSIPKMYFPYIPVKDMRETMEKESKASGKQFQKQILIWR